MPSIQRGSVYKTSRGYGIQWRDEDGVRRRQSGFGSRSAAREWFDNVERRRMRGELAAESLTLAEFAERYLRWYGTVRKPSSVETLRWRLVRPLAELGSCKLSDLRTGEIAAWQATLPPRFRHAVVRALRQVLDAAVAWDHLAANPAKKTGANPAPEVIEERALEPSEVDVLATEFGSPFDVATVVAAWCYLRPSETLALERSDLLGGGLLHVRGTKTRGSTRICPIPAPARHALDSLPPRIDTTLLFPGPSGKRYDQRNFTRREFVPARQAAGLEKTVTAYTLRHSGISWALAAGVPPSDVAKFAGTSVEMLQRTYAHLLQSSADTAKARMDAFAGSFGPRMAHGQKGQS